jgi:hypothetical protein
MQLPSSPRRRCLTCRAAADFLAVLPLPPLSRRRSLHRRHDATLFIAVTMLLPLVPRRRCLLRHNNAAFIVTTQLPSSSRRHSLHCCHDHLRSAASIAAPPLPSSPRRRYLYCHTAVTLLGVPWYLYRYFTTRDWFSHYS